MEIIFRTEQWEDNWWSPLAAALFVLVSTRAICHQNVLDLFLWKYLHHKKLQNCSSCMYSIYGMWSLPLRSSICLSQCDLIIIWECTKIEHGCQDKNGIFSVHMGIGVMKFNFPADCCCKALRSEKRRVSQSLFAQSFTFPHSWFFSYRPQGFLRPILMRTVRFPAVWSVY